MKKNIFTLLVCLCIIMFAACEDTGDNGNGSSADASINIVKVEAKELLAPVYGEDASETRAVAGGANDFAFLLGGELLKDSGGSNFVCSPYSVWLPLAALVNATDDQNKAALTEALGASGIAPADINKAASRMLYDLTKIRDKQYESYGSKYYNPLKIANAVFVDKKVTLQKEFAQTFMDYYRGASINVDFSSKDAVDAVNRWASDNTGGLIKDLIKEFDPQTVTAIANAIYFSDRWAWEFDPEKTKEDVFHVKEGENSKASYMLRQGDGQLYYEDAAVQATWLRFKHDGGMYIILPRDKNATGLLSSMTNEYLKKIDSGFELAEGKLLLPRFSIENDISDLKDALVSLGVPLFDGSPLNGLIKEYPLVLTAAIQRALIKVDEKGTTAAAVTVMEGAGSAGPGEKPKPFEMICDRPFVFILCESTYDGGDQILFTGVVNKP
jgi:serpin B